MAHTEPRMPTAFGCPIGGCVPVVVRGTKERTGEPRPDVFHVGHNTDGFEGVVTPDMPRLSDFEKWDTGARVWTPYAIDPDAETAEVLYQKQRAEVLRMFNAGPAARLDDLYDAAQDSANLRADGVVHRGISFDLDMAMLHELLERCLGPVPEWWTAVERAHHAIGAVVGSMYQSAPRTYWATNDELARAPIVQFVRLNEITLYCNRSRQIIHAMQPFAHCVHRWDELV